MPNRLKIQQIADNIYFARPPLFQRLGILSTTANASYNDILNTIILQDDLFFKKKGQPTRLKDYDDSQTEKINYFSLNSVSIFHELAHADIDIFIEEDPNSEMYQTVVNEIPKWAGENIYGFNAKSVTHEIIGYTAGNILEVLNNKINTILTSHGIHPNLTKCFSTGALIKTKSLLNIDADIKFKDVLKRTSFYDEFIPKDIFIKGRHISVKGFPLVLKRKVLNYFIKTYAISIDSTTLIRKMNNSHYREKLADCYNPLL